MMAKRVKASVLLLVTVLLAIWVMGSAWPPHDDCLYSGVECVWPLHDCWYFDGIAGFARTCLEEYYCVSVGYYYESCGLCECLPMP
jgi:hypothetical protein